MTDFTFEIEDDDSDEAYMIYWEIVRFLTHPYVISSIFVALLFFTIRKPWPRFLEVKSIRDIVTDIITQRFPGIRLGAPSETRTHIHIPITVNVEEQFFVVTYLVEEVRQYGCDVLAMSTTDYPNRRNFVIRIPLNGHRCTGAVTLRREIIALCTSLFLLSIVHYALKVAVFK